VKKSLGGEKEKNKGRNLNKKNHHRTKRKGKTMVRQDTNEWKEIKREKR